MKEALKAEKQRERKNEKSETHKSLSTTTECVANAFYYIFSSFRVFEDDLQCTQTGTHRLWPAYVLRTHTHTTNKFIKMVFIYLWRCLCSVFTITYVFIGSRFDSKTEKILNKHTLSRPTANTTRRSFFFIYIFFYGFVNRAINHGTGNSSNTSKRDGEEEEERLGHIAYRHNMLEVRCTLTKWNDENDRKGEMPMAKQPRKCVRCFEKQCETVKKQQRRRRRRPSQYDILDGNEYMCACSRCPFL